MKPICTTLLFFSMFFFGIYGQNRSWDLETRDLYGKVKYIEKCEYLPVQTNGEVIKGERVQDKFKFEEHITFNEDGNITDCKDYGLNGELCRTYLCTYRNGKLEREDFYNSTPCEHMFALFTYDESRNEVKYVHYLPDLTIDEYSYTTYDAKGRAIAYKYYYENILRDDWTQVYDKKGRGIEHRYTGENMGDTVISKYTYDKKGNMIESVNTNWYSGKSVWDKYRCTYNKFGQEIKREYLDLNNNPRIKMEFEYDKKGKITLETTTTEYDDELNKVETKRTIYVYDKQGNWIQKTEFKNETPVCITERKIEYY